MYLNTLANFSRSAVASRRTNASPWNLEYSLGGRLDERVRTRSRVAGTHHLLQSRRVDYKARNYFLADAVLAVVISSRFTHDFLCLVRFR